MAQFQSTVFLPKEVLEAANVLATEVPEGAFPKQGWSELESPYGSLKALFNAFGSGFGLKDETSKAYAVVAKFIDIAESYTKVTGEVPVFTADYYGLTKNPSKFEYFASYADFLENQ